MVELEEQLQTGWKHLLYPSLKALERKVSYQFLQVVQTFEALHVSRPNTNQNY